MYEYSNFTITLKSKYLKKINLGTYITRQEMKQKYNTNVPQSYRLP